MRIKEIQEQVDEWIGQWKGGYWSPLSNLARLTEEVGELARVINHLHGDKVKKEGELQGDIAEEIGDVLFVLVAIANSMNIDLEDTFHDTLEKYNVRDKERFVPNHPTIEVDSETSHPINKKKDS